MLTLLVIYGLADDTFAKALIHGECPMAMGFLGQLNVYLFCAIWGAENKERNCV